MKQEGWEGGARGVREKESCREEWRISHYEFKCEIKAIYN